MGATLYLVLEVGHRSPHEWQAAPPFAHKICKHIFFRCTTPPPFASQKTVLVYNIHYQKQNPRNLGFYFWWNFTTPLEPILAQNANSLSRAVCPAKLDAPHQKTLCIFFEISPAVIYWIWKRVFLVVRLL